MWDWGEGGGNPARTKQAVGKNIRSRADGRWDGRWEQTVRVKNSITYSAEFGLEYFKQ